MDGSKVSEVAKEFFKKRDLLFHVYLPVDKHIIKKNNRPIYTHPKTRRPFLGKNKELVQAENHLISAFTEKTKAINLLTPIADDVWLMALFHICKKDYYTQKGVRKKTLGDLSNMYQIVEDCLQTARVIENDSLIQAHDWSRILPAEETALEVYVLRYKKSEYQENSSKKYKLPVIEH